VVIGDEELIKGISLEKGFILILLLTLPEGFGSD
jgi:hypothetical protein